MGRATARPSTHAISFDVEHWYQATLLREAVDAPAVRIAESVGIVLDLLARHDARGTFFVVGEVASEYPAVVGRIAEEGHEVASHGHTHTPLFGRSPEWFEQELERSREAIGDTTGVEPAGFRAPNFSITRETAWALPVLASSGYRYDSSVFPARTPMYGVPDAPVRPYVVDGGDPFRSDGGGSPGQGLVEFPLAVLDVGPRLPIAGGFYARVLPTRVIEYGVERCGERGVPATLYFHPWEFNPAVRTSVPPAHKRLVSFWGIDRLERKVDRLLERFEFGAIDDVLDGHGLADSPGGDRHRFGPAETDGDGGPGRWRGVPP